MAAKTTVYIPDDLHEEVQKHGDINVSGILQEALRKELQVREATKGLSPQAAAVRRKLEQSSDMTIEKRFPLWYQAGRHNAPALELGDLEEVVEFYTDYVEGANVRDLEFSFIVKQTNGIFDYDGLEIRRAGPAAAFLAGVAHVYREAVESED